MFILRSFQHLKQSEKEADHSRPSSAMLTNVRWFSLHFYPASWHTSLVTGAFPQIIVDIFIYVAYVCVHLHLSQILWLVMKLFYDAMYRMNVGSDTTLPTLHDPRTSLPTDCVLKGHDKDVSSKGSLPFFKHIFM
jgi:hypothetical protein